MGSICNRLNDLVAQSTDIYIKAQYIDFILILKKSTWNYAFLVYFGVFKSFVCDLYHFFCVKPFFYSGGFLKDSI